LSDRASFVPAREAISTSVPSVIPPALRSSFAFIRAAPSHLVSYRLPPIARLNRPLVQDNRPNRPVAQHCALADHEAVSETTESVGGRGYRLGELQCEECGEQAPLFAAGWCAYGSNEPFTDELPALAFYCPDCAVSVSDPNVTA
jgi:hypothetical protein